jgi:hypothetical protein
VERETKFGFTLFVFLGVRAEHKSHLGGIPMARILLYRSDDYSRIGLERAYAYFDRLHDIASEGHVRELASMPPVELIEYLNEVSYTIEETIREIREHEERARARAVDGREEKSGEEGIKDAACRSSD